MNIIQVPAYFFTAGRDGNPVTGITVHWMDGTMASADATFTGGSRQASAHYGVEDGTVHQYVQERDTAWACGNWAANLDTVSIEHSAQPGRDATDATYQTSGQLIADICTRHGITPGPGTIRPHHDFTSTSCPGTLDVDRLIDGALSAMGAPAAATITPLPATPAQIEDDMKVLATNGTDPQVWIGDGIIRRPVWTLDTLTADQWLARNSVLGPFYRDGEVQIIPDLNSIGLDLMALVGKPVTG